VNATNRNTAADEPSYVALLWVAQLSTFTR
jgi:hypothetical protein